MSKRFLSVLPALVLAAIPGALLAQEFGEALARIECISMPADVARRAMRQHPKENDLYAWLGAELEKGNAEVRLEKLCVARARMGQLSRLEEVDEVPTVSTYEPGQIPQFFDTGAAPPGNPAPGTKANPGTPGIPGAGTVLAPGAVSTRLFPPWPYQMCKPSSFSTRNAGWTIELKLSPNDAGGGIEVNLTQEFTRFNGTVCQVSSGEETQPLFETARFNTTFLTKPGKLSLAGTMNPATNTGTPRANTVSRTCFVFFTLSGAGIKPAPPAPKPLPPAEVMLRFDLISLPPLMARKALLEHPNETDFYDWLDAQLTRKDSGVALEYTSVMRGFTGQRAKVDSATSYPLATEVENASIPQTFSIGPAGPLPALPAGAGKVFPPFPLTPPTLGNFTFRNLGSSLEMEINGGGDDGTLDIKFTPSVSRLASLMPMDLTGDMTQPVIESRRMQVSLFAPSGRPVLAGTLNRPVGTGVPGGNTVDQVSLLFVTASLPQ